jgi:hypothetical protein
MKKILNTILILLLIVMVYSCDKEKDEPFDEAIIVPTGKVWMHLHNTVGSNDVELYNTTYFDANGRGLRLSKAQFYISNIELVKLNDEVVPAKNILLKTLEEESYLIGDISVGNYKAVRFKLGLTDDLNNLSPDVVSTNELKDTSMWYNSGDYSDGYVYLNAVGEVDTSIDLSGKYASFDYKFGTSSNLVTVNLPENTFPVYEGIISYIHLNADYSQLFQNLDIKDVNNLNLTTVQGNNTKTELVTTLKTNISNLFFSFE